MAVVQLIVLSTGQDFAIDDSQIIEAIPLNSAFDSTLVFEELGRVKSINVDETCSAIASASGTVFPVTAYVSGNSGNTVVRYISASKCKELIQNTSYRTIQYNNAGVELVSINVSDTLASLISLINVSSSDFVTIAGAQTVVGAKTFSAAVVASSGVNNSGATIFAGFYPKAPQQTISGAGAINITSWLTNMTTTGANAYTLANATVVGQKKKIVMVVDVGDGTLTPTSLASATTITFNDAADFVELLWDGAAWNIIQNSGCTVA